MSFGAQADEPTTTTTTIVQKFNVVSPAPKAVCITVPAATNGNVYIAEHQECTYENRPEKWIDAYWSCTAATPDGTCTTWTFVPGRMETVK